MPSTYHSSLITAVFLALFETTKDRLYRLFVKQTGDRHLAEDLLQDCYLRTWEKRDILTAKNGEKYITGIAYNVLADWHRMQVKKKLVYMSEVPAEAAEALTPGDLVSFKETQQMAVKTIAALSEEKRTAFLLIKEEEKSYKEVAATLDKPVSTLEKQVASSMAALRKVLKTTPLFSWLG
jgi:RNA polymerase sigma-70 factor (ECF subfamily)